MIYIDFQGGSHGNYLDFVCNKFLAKIPCNELPFNSLGASHSKSYLADKEFTCGHYFADPAKKAKLHNNKIISIQITPDDLLPLSAISLLRAGDHNIDNDRLEINTYHKLNNSNYRWVLDNIIKNFFQTQVRDSYNFVKDTTWPPVNTIDDFEKLDDWIKHECLTQHKLKLLQFDADHPDCPRHVLREFFKLSFYYPDRSGFMTLQKNMVYDISNDVFVFPFGCFYDTKLFVDQIRLVSLWSGYDLQDFAPLEHLHEDFLQRQPYKDSKKICDHLIQRICESQVFTLPKLDLMQESYLSAKLENYFGREFPADQTEWFDHSRQILDYMLK